MSHRLLQNLAAITTLIALMCTSHSASATEFSEIGQGLDNIGNESAVDISGFLRLRGESLYNLDLDHGLTPSGLPLYPVPLGDPTAQRLNHSDARFRTDLSLYAPFGQVRVNSRIDVVDNLTLGSTPRDSLDDHVARSSQRARLSAQARLGRGAHAVRCDRRRAYGEHLGFGDALQRWRLPPV